MDSDETPYLLPDGEPVWVIKTPAAAELLPHMLERFRFGHLDPLIFGDAGEPEGVVVPFELWRALDTRVFDEEGFDTTYAIARARLADPRPSIPFDQIPAYPEPSIPLEKVAAEHGWDLNEPIHDSDLPK